MSALTMKFWQSRLPSVFTANNITLPPSPFIFT